MRLRYRIRLIAVFPKLDFMSFTRKKATAIGLQSFEDSVDLAVLGLRWLFLWEWESLGYHVRRWRWRGPWMLSKGFG